MLLTGLQRLQQASMEIAYLGVDTENPNCAQTLYESVGFRKVHANFCYRKSISIEKLPFALPRAPIS